MVSSPNVVKYWVQYDGTQNQCLPILTIHPRLLDAQRSRRIVPLSPTDAGHDSNEAQHSRVHHRSYSANEGTHRQGLGGVAVNSAIVKGNSDESSVRQGHYSHYDEADTTEESLFAAGLSALRRGLSSSLAAAHRSGGREGRDKEGLGQRHNSLGLDGATAGFGRMAESAAPSASNSSDFPLELARALSSRLGQDPR